MSSLSIRSAVRLSSGHDMPRLGLGVAYGWDKPVDVTEVTKPAVLEALKAGYRLLDTALMYNNEKEVGDAIRESGVPREEIFVTTKINSAIKTHSTALQAVDDALTKIGVDYIDLFLIHDPKAGKQSRLEVYEALLEAKQQGKIHSVGVSNYGVKHIEEIEAAGYELPSVNQVELQPFCQQKEIVVACSARNIVIQAYCPIIRGKMDDPIIVEVANKYKKDPAQVLIRWSLQNGFVPLPKSSQPERIRSNAALYDFELAPEDMGRLNALDRGKAGAISWNPVDVD